LIIKVAHRGGRGDWVSPRVGKQQAKRALETVGF